MGVVDGTLVAAEATLVAVVLPLMLVGVTFGLNTLLAPVGGDTASPIWVDPLLIGNGVQFVSIGCN